MNDINKWIWMMNMIYDDIYGCMMWYDICIYKWIYMINRMNVWINEYMNMCVYDMDVWINIYMILMLIWIDNWIYI